MSGKYVLRPRDHTIQAPAGPTAWERAQTQDARDEMLQGAQLSIITAWRDPTSISVSVSVLIPVPVPVSVSSCTQPAAPSLCWHSGPAPRLDPQGKRFTLYVSVPPKGAQHNTLMCDSPPLANLVTSVSITSNPLLCLAHALCLSFQFIALEQIPCLLLRQDCELGSQGQLL